MERDLIRYTLQLEMLERDGVLADPQAIALLRGEFALAHNAGRFDALTAGDMEVGAIARSTPQEGVTRYAVDLSFAERNPDQDDDRALARLKRAFTSALNASYFLRLCTDDDIAVSLLARSPATPA